MVRSHSPYNISIFVILLILFVYVLSVIWVSNERYVDVKKIKLPQNIPKSIFKKAKPVKVGVNTSVINAIKEKRQRIQAKRNAELEALKAKNQRELSAAVSGAKNEARIAAEKAKKLADIEQRAAEREARLIKQKAEADAAMLKRRAQIEASQETSRGRREAAEIRRRADIEAQNERNNAIKKANEIKNKANQAKQKAENDKRVAQNKLASEQARGRTEGAREYNIIVKRATAQANAEIAKAELNKVVRENASKHGAVPGYFKTGYSFAGDYFNSSGPRQCREVAYKRGHKYWGFRNHLHGAPAYKNSCFFYNSGPNYSGEVDTVHMIGCTYGGTPESGCDQVGQEEAEKIQRMYRYVRVARKREYGGHHLNLGLLKVWSNYQDVANGKPVVATSNLDIGKYPPSNLTDGNADTFAHTNDNTWEHFTIDLGDVYTIDKVEIYNRKDCCQERAKGVFVELSNSWNFDDSVRRSRNVTPTEANAWRCMSWDVKNNTYLDPSVVEKGEYIIKGGNSNKYCQTSSSSDRKFSCNSGSLIMSPTKKAYTITPVGGNKYTIKNVRYKTYCTDQSDGTIKCNKTTAGESEKFMIDMVGVNQYAIRGPKNKQYCADEGHRTICNRNAIGGWERFTFIKR